MRPAFGWSEQATVSQMKVMWLLKGNLRWFETTAAVRLPIGQSNVSFFFSIFIFFILEFPFAAKLWIHGLTDEKEHSWKPFFKVKEIKKTSQLFLQTCKLILPKWKWECTLTILQCVKWSEVNSFQDPAAAWLFNGLNHWRNKCYCHLNVIPLIIHVI